MIGANAALWIAALQGSSPRTILARWSVVGGTLKQTSGGTAASADSDPVGSWADDTGVREIAQATSGKRPLLRTATPSVDFDGSDDHLLTATAISAASGSLVLLFVTGATAFAARGAQVLISGADSTAADKWFEVGITADGRVYVEFNNAGTKNTVVGASYLDVSTAYALLVAFDGTDYYVALGTTEQNPLIITSTGTCGWFGSVSGANNLVLGGTVTSAGLVRPFQGSVLEAAIYTVDIT